MKKRVIEMRNQENEKYSMKKAKSALTTSFIGNFRSYTRNIEKNAV